MRVRNLKAEAACPPAVQSSASLGQMKTQVLHPLQDPVSRDVSLPGSDRIAAPERKPTVWAVEVDLQGPQSVLGRKLEFSSVVPLEPSSSCWVGRPFLRRIRTHPQAAPPVSTVRGPPGSLPLTSVLVTRPRDPVGNIFLLSLCPHLSPHPLRTKPREGRQACGLPTGDRQPALGTLWDPCQPRSQGPG